MVRYPLITGFMEWISKNKGVFMCFLDDLCNKDGDFETTCKKNEQHEVVYTKNG
jgi:hypothetical protein